MQNGDALIKPLKIGALVVEYPVILAPMAGYTDAAARFLAARFRCGMTFTEVTSAEGIVRGSRQTWHILETFPGERPVAAHVYGSSPDTLARAAAAVAETGRFQTIDLNCGCPVSRIVARGAGAALMEHPEKIAQIVRAMKKASPLPVTVKTRLGPAPGRMNISETARAAEDGGADAIAIHARYTTAGHAGPAGWEALAKTKAELAIPVIGNGGIGTAEDARRMIAETGVAGVMVGKAAIGNPWIFDEIHALFHGRAARPHTLAEHLALIEEHLRLCIAHKEKALKARRHPRRSAELEAVLHFRCHLVGYARGFRGCAELKRKLQALRTAEDVLELVKLYLQDK